MPDGRKGIQDQVTRIGREAADFHNDSLLWMCALISIFVLALLGYTMVRYPPRRQPDAVAQRRTTPRSRSSGPWSRC